MNMKHDLEAADIDCNSILDFGPLAKQVLQGPADSEYANHLLQQPQTTEKLLDMAEEAVNSLDDMRKLSSAVCQLDAGDESRMQRVKQKLEEWEISQEKYAAFQHIEKELTRYNEFIALANQVTVELEDPSYASQLLHSAQKILDNSPFYLEKYQSLILAVDRITEDRDWVMLLLDRCREKIAFFIQIQSLGQLASTELNNYTSGLEWARSLYQGWERKLLSELSISPFELSKLARSIRKNLGDHCWAISLLEKAGEESVSHLDLCWLGHYASQWGEAELSGNLYQAAADKCENAAHYSELIMQLRSFKEPEPLLRKLYAQGEQKLNDPISILRWAEGIMREFSDLEWATRIYEALQPGFENHKAWAIYKYSRKHWIHVKNHGHQHLAD